MIHSYNGFNFFELERKQKKPNTCEKRFEN